MAAASGPSTSTCPAAACWGDRGRAAVPAASGGRGPAHPPPRDRGLRRSRPQDVTMATTSADPGLPAAAACCTPRPMPGPAAVQEARIAVLAANVTIPRSWPPRRARGRRSPRSLTVVLWRLPGRRLSRWGAHRRPDVARARRRSSAAPAMGKGLRARDHSRGPRSCAAGSESGHRGVGGPPRRSSGSAYLARRCDGEDRLASHGERPVPRLAAAADAMREELATRVPGAGWRPSPARRSTGWRAGVGLSYERKFVATVAPAAHVRLALRRDCRGCQRPGRGRTPVLPFAHLGHRRSPSSTTPGGYAVRHGCGGRGTDRLLDAARRRPGQDATLTSRLAAAAAVDPLSSATSSTSC